MISRILMSNCRPRRDAGQFRAGKPQLGLKRPLLFGAQRSAHESESQPGDGESRCKSRTATAYESKPGVTSPCSSAKPVRWVSASVAPAPWGDLGPMPVRSVNA